MAIKIAKITTVSTSLIHDPSTYPANVKTEPSTSPEELVQSTNGESTSVGTSYLFSRRALFESPSYSIATTETSSPLLLTGENRPTINTRRTTDFRATEAVTTHTYHSIETSENQADHDSVTTELDSPFENLTIAATKYIQHVLSGILAVSQQLVMNVVK
ncbi:hypothetical protein HOLleu_34406 [Holothuria leucospilota]|uniref:Uncharacterized protein n=1 Tax=Holothuria leucospilota TaxID=206669 RepID=A0A9Q0YL49_HOLLE|nr:hypothetical protein HOLleu_34406 [Holothuria leucospilota]